MLLSSAASTEQVAEEEYHCPLNAAYLLQQLSAMENLPLHPSPDQVAPLKNHATRMTAEELKNGKRIPREVCDYFEIGLNLEGLENGLNEFPKQYALHKIAELSTEAQKCSRWITERFEDKEKPIESDYCL